jgi:FkbM family methyltransferase
MWRAPYIRSLNATHVFDIGANTGEFALIARAAFPMAKIFSFEPLDTEFNTLNEVMKKDPLFESFKIALGETDGTAVMHVSEFSPSSSFVFKSANSSPQSMEIKTLDHYEYLIRFSDTVIIKMDVEGYELSILKGAEKVLAKSDWLYIECRIGNGEGAAFADIYSLMISRGWVYEGAYDSAFSKDGRLMYFDAFFRNAGKLNTQVPSDG